MKHLKPKTHRRAVSLVELTILMSACTVVLTLSAVLMHRAMRSNAYSRACQDVERNTTRLSDQFRRDVHEARTALIDGAALGAGVFLRFELAGDQTAEYRRQEGNIVRILSKGGNTVSRIEYAFAPACHVKVAEASAPRRIALTITIDPAEPPAGNAQRPLAMEEIPVSLQAEAVLGRDARFTKALITEARSE